MAHDPRREDYQRLALRFALSIDDPSEAAQAFSTFGRRFARDRDSLPQTDADRAFHLVALASEIVDYRMLFSPAESAAQLSQRVDDLLDEALSLDPACHDAARMRLSLRASREASSLDGLYQELAGRADAVRDSCEAERERSGASLSGEQRQLGTSLAMRPYWRWLAAMAELALICGRNREAIEVSERLLATDRHDLSDVRFTLAYALAKLEDETGLQSLVSRYPSLCAPRGADDAWILLAQVALAHKRWDLGAARALMERLLGTYLGCADVLIRQTELPDGEFARLRVPPYGEDELVLAVSEGIVLLQEGAERSGRGVLGSWVARTAAELDPQAARRVAEASPAEGARRP